MCGTVARARRLDAIDGTLAIGFCSLPLWGHIKSFLRNQDRNEGDVWGVGFQMSGVYFSSRDAARRLEGCFSASESAA